jgi:lipopolysaccharide biosynthesis glycosyltransferase
MREDVIKIFIGYDPVETVAWHVMAESILRRSSKPVAIIPVNIRNFKDFFTRPRDPKQSNEFSFTRFLVPYLANYKGYALFFDCDMMLRTDIFEIFDAVKKDPGKAVYVVKHNYEPRDDVKYLDTIQYKYPRKNWSSVMLWECSHPKNKSLTAEFVNQASGIDLHRFTWLSDDDIGELDVKWNWLVGEYAEPPQDVKNVHWTVGGPYFKEYDKADFAEEWFEEKEKINFCKQREF